MSRFFIKILFLLPPENAHYFTLRLLEIILHIPVLNRLLYSNHKNKDTSVEVAGMVFRNRLGLAAGFDKNAKYMDVMKAMGFAFMEIGTVTPKPQAGNPKPRLFRLKKDKAVINRMGFNNDGVVKIRTRLEKFKRDDFVIGGNIGKNKDTPNENAVDDFLECFEELHDVVDYFTINVSSPNTPQLRELQSKESLLNILNALQKSNNSKDKPKPIFVKIAPDLSYDQINQIIESALEAGIAGLIANNTTVGRNGLTYPESYITNIGAGGLSGKPVTRRSLEIMRYLRSRSGGKLLLIGSGGIMTFQDAKERIEAGADLIQVYTGFIYGGLKLVKELKNL